MRSIVCVTPARYGATMELETALTQAGLSFSVVFEGPAENCPLSQSEPSDQAA